MSSKKHLTCSSGSGFVNWVSAGFPNDRTFFDGFCIGEPGAIRQFYLNLRTAGKPGSIGFVSFSSGLSGML
jgi:hypothetical protein